MLWAPTSAHTRFERLAKNVFDRHENARILTLFNKSLTSTSVPAVFGESEENWKLEKEGKALLAEFTIQFNVTCTLQK